MINRQRIRVLKNLMKLLDQEHIPLDLFQFLSEMDKHTTNDGMFSLGLEEIFPHYLEKDIHTINKSRIRVKQQYFHIPQKPNIVDIVLTSQMHQDMTTMFRNLSINYLNLFSNLD